MMLYVQKKKIIKQMVDGVEWNTEFHALLVGSFSRTNPTAVYCPTYSNWPRLSVSGQSAPLRLNGTRYSHSRLTWQRLIPLNRSVVVQYLQPRISAYAIDLDCLNGSDQRSAGIHTIRTRESCYQRHLQLTGFFIRSAYRFSLLKPRFDRTKTYTHCMSSQVRKSFSIKTLPRNPVPPVTKTQAFL